MVSLLGHTQEEGRSAGVNDQVRQLIGRKPREFGPYAQDHRAARQPPARARVRSG